MREKTRIYTEGGSGHKSEDVFFRKGLNTFFKNAKAEERIQIVACGGRDSAHDKFQNARNQHPEDYSILLVDSEGAVNASAKQHLIDREKTWNIEDVDEDQCQLMVQMTEAWFVADPDGLERYYGKDFKKSKLPKNPKVEEISKKDLMDGLQKASRDTTKGEYNKTLKICGGILEAIDSDVVRKKAPHCERLFAFLLQE
jgi:hypothetical protein